MNLGIKHSYAFYSSFIAVYYNATASGSSAGHTDICGKVFKSHVFYDAGCGQASEQSHEDRHRITFRADPEPADSVILSVKYSAVVKSRITAIIFFRDIDIVHQHSTWLGLALLFQLIELIKVVKQVIFIIYLYSFVIGYNIWCVALRKRERRSFLHSPIH